MTEQKFSDGTSSGYAELPVPAAWLTWTRGEAKLAALKATDPALYFGGWRAFVKNADGESNPALPIPVVERTSEDGKHKYSVYASNVITFLPIFARMRYEMRAKVKDEETGREYEKTVAVSKEKRQGYAPNRQVFGIVYSEDGKFGYAVLKVNKWSAFISFEKAGQAWNKVKAPVGKLLVRRYGSVGGKDGSPNFEIFGQGRSTPIEAIDLAHPVFVDLTPELDALYDAALVWKNCPAWNAEGDVNEPAVQTAKDKFLALAIEMRLTDVEIGQILAENKNDYAVALKNISPETINDENPYE